MSTTVFDEQEVSTLREQRPMRPWRSRPPRFWAAVIVGSVVPLAIVAGLWLTLPIPGAVLMVVIYLPLQLVAAAGAALATKGRQGVLDAFLYVLAVGATLFSLIVLGSLIASLLLRGLKALAPHFLFQNNVYVSPSTPLEYGGIGHALIGTVLIVLISMVIAIPIGIATALYVTEVRGRAVPYVRFFVQAMSGVPSVVAGLFILTTLILTGALQTSALAGGLAYAILMLPTIARTAEEVLRLVPEDLRTGALALGSTRARVVLRVVLPAARTGIITAIVLGVARVIGETAPLLMTVGIADRTILDPVSSPIAALPTYIFTNVAQPYPDAVTRAWGASLALMILVAVLFTIARVLGRGRVGARR